MRSSTTAAFPGSARVSPSGACTTTLTLAWSKALVAPGKSSAWRSAACSEGMPGMVKLSDIGLEKAAARPMITASTTTHAAMKNGQRR